MENIRDKIKPYNQRGVWYAIRLFIGIILNARLSASFSWLLRLTERG